MALPPSLIALLIALIPTITALPVTSEHTLHKRSSSAYNVGIGFAIAISILIFASVVFYLGVQRGRKGTWFCWREPLPSSSPTSRSEMIHVIGTEVFKNRISSPIQTHSSALPELSPLEAQPKYVELSTVGTKPKFLELSASELAVFELAQPSPKRPPSVVSTSSKTFYSSRKSSIATAYRKSVASLKTNSKGVYSTTEKPPKVNSWFDRKSWFCRGAMEVEDEEKRLKSKNSVGASIDTLLQPPAAVAILDCKKAEERDTMDWSGMEWVAKVYDERRWKRLSGMRSFYIPDNDEKISNTNVTNH